MDQLRETKKCLKVKNDTRWNSVYLMIKSFIKLDKQELDYVIRGGKKLPKKKVDTSFLLSY